jgi:hypothetical protein
MRAADRKIQQLKPTGSALQCHEGQTRRQFFRRNGLWSALQTHLQGVDGATLAMVPEKCVHCAALLSR